MGTPFLWPGVRFDGQKRVSEVQWTEHKKGQARPLRGLVGSPSSASPMLATIMISVKDASATEWMRSSRPERRSEGSGPFQVIRLHP